MSEICPLCRGAGARVTFRLSQRQYWPCQACDGDGAVQAYGPPAMAIGRAQARFLKPDPSEQPEGRESIPLRLQTFVSS